MQTSVRKYVWSFHVATFYIAEYIWHKFCYLNCTRQLTLTVSIRSRAGVK